jgi:hypothetical protein
MLRSSAGKPVRAFVIWEPVMATDWTSPSIETMARIADPRVAQFWDKARLISHAMGEHDRRSIVWDYIAVYPPGAVWTDERPPEPVYHGRPVVEVKDEAMAAVASLNPKTQN